MPTKEHIRTPSSLLFVALLAAALSVTLAACDELVDAIDDEDPDGVELERERTLGASALYFPGDTWDEIYWEEVRNAPWEGLYVSVAGDHLVDDDGGLAFNYPAGWSDWIVFWRGDAYPQDDIRHEFGFEEGDAFFPGDALVLAAAPDAFVNAVGGEEYADRLGEEGAAETLESQADVLIPLAVLVEEDRTDLIEAGGLWFPGDALSEVLSPGDTLFPGDALFPDGELFPGDALDEGHRLLPLAVSHWRSFTGGRFFREDVMLISGAAAVDAMAEPTKEAIPDAFLDAFSEDGAVLSPGVPDY